MKHLHKKSRPNTPDSFEEFGIPPWYIFPTLITVLGSGPQDVGYIRIGCLTTSNMHISPVTLMSLHPRGRPKPAPGRPFVSRRPHRSLHQSAKWSWRRRRALTISNGEGHISTSDLFTVTTGQPPLATCARRSSSTPAVPSTSMAYFSAKVCFPMPRYFIFLLRSTRHTLCDRTQSFALPCTKMARWSRSPSSTCILNCLMVFHGLIEVHLVSFSRGGPRADATRLPCPSLPDAVPGSQEEKTTKCQCLELLERSKLTESERGTLQSSAGPCKHGYHAIKDDMASTMGTSG